MSLLVMSKLDDRRSIHNLCRFMMIVSFLVLTACGGCPKADQAWQRARAQSSKVRSGPHWMLEIQTQEVTRRLQPAKKSVNRNKGKLKVKTPVPGVKLAPLKFRLNDFKWVIDGKRGILKIIVGVVIQGKEVIKISLHGASPLQMDLKAKKLKLAIRADQFKRADMKLGDDAQRALRKAIYKQIPREFRRLVPEKELLKVVKRTLKLINDKGYPIIRKKLLTPLGTLARLEWDLPDYPINRMALKADGEVWRVGLWTTIKADGWGRSVMKRGIGGQGSEPMSVGARLYISAPWIASAGNWAMAEGKLPSQFDRSGKPKKGGRARAAMTWRSGKRPLKVHLWAAQQSQLSMCLYARVGIKPDLKVAQGQLVVNAEGKLERVEGNPLAKTAVRLSGIGERVLRWHHNTSAPTQMKVGGVSTPLAWMNIALNRRYLMAGIDLGGLGVSQALPRQDEFIQWSPAANVVALYTTPESLGR